MTTTPEQTAAGDLRQLLIDAIRAATYDCDGNCGVAEQECIDAHPMQVAAYHHDVVASVWAPVGALADIALAVLRAAQEQPTGDTPGCTCGNPGKRLLSHLRDCAWRAVRLAEHAARNTSRPPVLTAREDLLQTLADWGLTTGKGSRVHADRILAKHREEMEPELDAAYRERAHLLAWITRLYRHAAVLAPAPDVEEPGWSLLFLDVAGRQLSWHIHPRDAALFDHVPPVPADDPRAQWDGHTTTQKYQRIQSLADGEMRAALAEDGCATCPQRATEAELERRQRQAWSAAGRCPMCSWDGTDGRLCDTCEAEVRRMHGMERRKWQPYRQLHRGAPIQGRGYTPAGLLGADVDGEPTPCPVRVNVEYDRTQIRETVRGGRRIAHSVTPAALEAPCDHTGPDAGPWFDRAICPEPCGAMHERCSRCGAALGHCPVEEAGEDPLEVRARSPFASPEERRRVLDQLAREKPLRAEVVPCAGVFNKNLDAHEPHTWAPQPGMRAVWCPGHDTTPTPKENPAP